MVDYKNSTVLHHIAAAAGLKGRTNACNYYMECILRFISVYMEDPTAPEIVDPMIDSIVSSSASSESATNPGISIASLINAVDHLGNTAMNIAARVGSRQMIQLLLQAGADPTIANHAGLRPTDFGFAIDDVQKTVYMSVGTEDGGMEAANPEKSSNRTVLVYPSVRTEEEISSQCPVDDSSQQTGSIPSALAGDSNDSAQCQMRDMAHRLAAMRRENEMLQSQLAVLPTLRQHIRDLEDALNSEMHKNQSKQHLRDLDQALKEAAGNNSMQEISSNDE
eukprot:jgi/Hompol1/4190/HPOL_006976-RA